MKTRNSTAAHRKGARHTACSQTNHEQISKHCSLEPRGDFKAVGFWTLPAQLLGRLVNKQKWRKNFQNVIYTHVYSTNLFCAETRPIRRKTHARFFCQIASVLALRKVRDRRSEPRRTRVSDNRILRGYRGVRCCFSRISKSDGAAAPRRQAPGCGGGSMLRSGQERRALCPVVAIRHGCNDLTGVDPTCVTRQVLVQQRKALACQGRCS